MATRAPLPRSLQLQVMALPGPRRKRMAKPCLVGERPSQWWGSRGCAWCSCHPTPLTQATGVHRPDLCPAVPTALQPRWSSSPGLSDSSALAAVLSLQQPNTGMRRPAQSTQRWQGLGFQLLINKELWVLRRRGKACATWPQGPGGVEGPRGTVHAPWAGAATYWDLQGGLRRGVWPRRGRRRLIPGRGAQCSF